MLSGEFFKKKDKHASAGTGWGIAGSLYDMFNGASTDVKAKQAADDKQKNDKAAAAKRDAAVEKMDDTSKQGVQTANEMALAINMFAGAVQSFSICCEHSTGVGSVGRGNREGRRLARFLNECRNSRRIPRWRKRHLGHQSLRQADQVGSGRLQG